MKASQQNEAPQTEALRNELTSALACSLQASLGSRVDAARIRLPARRADASLYLPDCAAPPCERCPSVFGVEPFSHLESINGLLLLTFSDALFSALVARVLETFPPAQNTFDDSAVSRMLLLARHEGAGCPLTPAFHRALLLLYNAHRSRGAYEQAAYALLRLFSGVPPRERAALTAQAGAYGDAAARLLLAAKRPFLRTIGHERADLPTRSDETTATTE